MGKQKSFPLLPFGGMSAENFNLMEESARYYDSSQTINFDLLGKGDDI